MPADAARPSPALSGAPPCSLRGWSAGLITGLIESIARSTSPTPVGLTALSRDALASRKEPRGLGWTTFLIRVQMTLIYLASASSKTLDDAWRSGEVLKGRGLGPQWEAMMPDFLLQFTTRVLGTGRVASLSTFASTR